MNPDPRTNSFQALIEAPDVRHFTEAERSALTVHMEQTQYADVILPALRAATVAHADSRSARLESGTRDDIIARTTEALRDPHFRKQRNYGPAPEELAEKVRSAFVRREPIQLVGLMFTRKNVCALKRSGTDVSEPDLAELVSLLHLDSFTRHLSAVFPYGARFTILSEGIRLRHAFDLEPADIHAYQETLRRWIRENGLHGLRLEDYESFLKERIRMEDVRGACYRERLEEYRSAMLPIFDPADMKGTLDRAIAADPIRDERNPRNNFVPLWDSIKHSIPYPELEAYTTASDAPYERTYREVFASYATRQASETREELRVMVLQRSWGKAIEHNARIAGDVAAGIDVATLVSESAFRATINPKPRSPHLGISSVRETSMRVQPWHGTAYVTARADGRLRVTVLTKLEIESRGGIPVVVGGGAHAFFYAAPEAIQHLMGEPEFDLSTR